MPRLATGPILTALATVLALTACDDTPTHTRHGTQDLDGLPNLIVDQATLARFWTIQTESLAPSSCTVIEAGIPAGTHRTLRFTVSTPNIGDADAYVGDPRAHIDPNGDGDYGDSDGLFEYASCHHHFHYRHYAAYELFPVHGDGSLGTPAEARKRGFCMRDDIPWGETSPDSWVYRECGTPTAPGSQGVAKGWADVYDRSLEGQFFLLDDPNEPVPPGEYLLRITVNPPYPRSAPGDACPATDPDGACRLFPESRYDDNVGEVRLTIPAAADRLVAARRGE